MNRTIRLINLVIQIIILGLCSRNVHSAYSIASLATSLAPTLDQYNDLLQIKLDSINSYLHSNLIDLNSLTIYLNRLNDYFSFFSSIDQIAVTRLDVCLSNRTDRCWHIEDTIDTIDWKEEFELIDNRRTPIFDSWFHSATYNLNNINLNHLNLHSLNSLNSLSFSLNGTINSTLTCLKDLTTLSSLKSSLVHTVPNSLSSLTNSLTLSNLNINRALFLSYLSKFDNEELKNLLVSFNLFMPFVCSAFLFLLCIQNQHRRKLIELNQLFRKIECLSGLQQIKEDMKTLAQVIDELKLDAKQNQELKIKLQKMLNNEFKIKQANIDNHPHHLDRLDINGNMIKSTKGDHDSISITFTEQIGHINQQLKLNQLEQSKLKYMVCKTIESFDRILNKMKNNCELINNQ